MRRWTTNGQGTRRTAAVVVAVLVTLLAACGPPGNDSEGSSQPQGAALRVRLGTQAFPEARILGELWRQALAVNGYTVDLRKGVGPAEDLDTALAAGEIDGYVAYTGTVLSIVAQQEVTGLSPDETYEKAKAFYDSKGMKMSAMTPFENKDAIAATTEFAQSNQLRSIADLTKVKNLTLAARPEFENLQLGLRGLQSSYGLTGVEFEAVPVGQQYTALDDGSAEVANAFTTDPALSSGDYTVLTDPERLFGAQNVVMTVGADDLDRVGSDTFLKVVDAVNSRLTEDAMISLNTEVEQGQTDAEVAKRFLTSVGLMTPIR